MERLHQSIHLDLIIPVYNEETTLPFLRERLNEVFPSSVLKEHGIRSVQYLLVDDGSKDQSAATIVDYIRQGFPARLIRLSRNFGHQNAVTAGLENAKGDVVAVLDADLQDPPEVVLEMIALWRKGYDVVYGQRRRRKESWFKVACYWSFYRLLKWLSDAEIAMDSGDFSLMDQRVVKVLCSLPEKLRFPRGLRSWVGFDQIGLPYERHRRVEGVSKYPLRKLYQLATDGIASMSVKPPKLTQLFAFLFALSFAAFFGLSCFAYLRHYAGHETLIWFLVGYTMISFSSFMILFALYILCGYVARIYLEVKERPAFIVKEIVDSQAIPLRTGPRALLREPLVVHSH
jgi:polyisoprenyl-phosphate glycosyltransferase